MTKKIYENDEYLNALLKLKQEYEVNLKQHGVKMPKINKLSINNLVLAHLYLNRGVSVTKEELTMVVRHFFQTNDVQSGRHLGAQKGFYILSKKRGDDMSQYGNGDYVFVTSASPLPGYSPAKRSGDCNDFEEIKNIYNNKCATCGTQEGGNFWHKPSSIAKLEKGHMNPEKSLTNENTIPQCQECNKSYKDWFIFDKNGKIKAISNADAIDNSTNAVKRKILNKLLEYFKEDK